MDELDFEYLAHYASKYYDPIKAHEYYLRNRELIGRSTKGLSEEGKQVWRDTKANITSERQQALKVAQEAHEQKVTEMRERASAARERIREALVAISAKIKEQLADETEETLDDLQDQSEKLEKKQEGTQAQIEQAKDLFEKGKEAIQQEIETLKVTLEEKEKANQENVEKILEELSKEKEDAQLKIENLMNEDFSNLPEELRKKKIAERNEEIAKITGDLDQKIETATTTIQTEQEEIEKITADLAEKKKTASGKIKKLKKETDDKVKGLQKEYQNTSEEVQKTKSKIKEKSSRDKTKIRDKGTGEKEDKRNEREQIANELTSSLNNAKTAYEATKEAIRGGYETTFANEFEAINREYGSGNDAKAPAVSKGGSGKSSEEKRKIRESLYKERIK